MQLKTASNPDTGERVVLVNNQWVPFTQSATNDTGEKAYLVNNNWITDNLVSANTYSQQQEPAPVARKPEDVGTFEGAAAGLRRGFDSFGDIKSGLGLGVSSVVGNEAETLRKMEAIKAGKQAPDAAPGMTVEDFERIVKEKGYLAAAKEVPKYILEQLGGSGPQMATPLAAGMAGSRVAGPVGGLAAGIGTYAIQQFGNFLVTQAQEKKDPKELEVAKAALTAAGTAPFGYFADKFTAGLGGSGKKAISEIYAELGKRGVIKEAAGRAATGATLGIIAEAPVEVLEQAAERWQAGQSLTGPEAWSAYKNAFVGAAAIGGGIGAVANIPGSKTPALPSDTQAPPGAIEAPQIDPEQYKTALAGLQGVIPVGGTTDSDKLTQTLSGMGIENPEDYLNYAKDTGDIRANTTPAFDVTNIVGDVVFRSFDETIANDAAQRLNDQQPQSASVVQVDVTRYAHTDDLADNAEIVKGQFRPDSTTFDISTGDTSLSKGLTAEEAQEKAPRLAELRNKKAASFDAEIKKYQDKIDNNNLTLETFEAEGKAGTPDYEALNVQTKENNALIQPEIDKLQLAKKAYSEPIVIKQSRPESISESGFTVFKDNKPVEHFENEELAQASVSKPTNVDQSIPTQEAVAAKEALRESILPFLKQVGLEKTGLRIMDSIESAQGSGDGSYANNLISIALDAANPMGTVRHETIHALKELGAFTDQEWKLLESTAKNDWINRFIKNRKTQDGRSLYDAYKAIYLQDPDNNGSLAGFDNYITEEAIADAFKFFDANGVPPGMLGQIFAKIKAFLETLGNGFSGLGFQTADQVFKQIEAGQMRPTRAAPQGNAPRYNLTPKEKLRRLQARESVPLAIVSANPGAGRYKQGAFSYKGTTLSGVPQDLAQISSDLVTKYAAENSSEENTSKWERLAKNRAADDISKKGVLLLKEYYYKNNVSESDSKEKTKGLSNENLLSLFEQIRGSINADFGSAALPSYLQRTAKVGDKTANQINKENIHAKAVELLQTNKKWIAKEFGLKNFQFQTVRGSFEGNPELSFAMTADNMTTDVANKLSLFLGVGFVQDQVVHRIPIDVTDENQFVIPSAIITNKNLSKISEEDATRFITAAKKVGLDYTEAVKGDGFVFHYFGDKSEIGDWNQTLQKISQESGLNNVISFNLSSDLYDANLPKGYTGEGREEGSGEDRSKDATTGSPVYAGSSWKLLVDKFLAPYVKSISGEGYRVSPDRFALRYGLNEAQTQYLREALYPKSSKGSVAPVLYDEEIVIVLPSKPSISDVGSKLADRSIVLGGQVEPGDHSEKAKKLVARVFADEVKRRIEQENIEGSPESLKKAQGWYEKTLKIALEKMSSIFPELAVDDKGNPTNKQARFLFNGILAITSQGMDVVSNFKAAATYYGSIRRAETNFLTFGQINPQHASNLLGDKHNAIEWNLKKFQEIINELGGWKEAEALMLNKSTVAELNKLVSAKLKNLELYNDEGKLTKVKVAGAAERISRGWSLFGPKIGSFANNLYGDYSTLTADLWFSRTWNRVLGFVYKKDATLEAKQMMAFRAAIEKEFSDTWRQSGSGEWKLTQHGLDEVFRYDRAAKSVVEKEKDMAALQDSASRDYNAASDKLKNIEKKWKSEGFSVNKKINSDPALAKIYADLKEIKRQEKLKMSLKKGSDSYKRDVTRINKEKKQAVNTQKSHFSWIGNSLPEKIQENLNGDPDNLFDFAHALYTEYAGAQFYRRTPLNAAAKNFFEGSSKLVAAPRSVSEGMFQQEVIEESRDILKNKLGINVEIADLQALLWFQEKDIYRKFGAANSKAAPLDYSDAANKTISSIKSGDLNVDEKKQIKFSAPASKEKYQLTAASIDVDGVMRSTRNNKGSLIAATEESIRNFWRWFGNSGVVDDKGNPRLVLHGTARDFESFTPKQAGAIFFTDSPKFADTYSKQLSPNWMVDHYRDFLTEEQIESAKAETLSVMDNLTREEYGLSQKSSPEEFAEIYEWELAVKSRLPSGPNTMPLYVKMENPFDYENKAHVEAVVDKLLGSKKSIKFQDDVRSMPPNPLSRDALLRYIHGDKSKEGKAARGGFWPLIENNQVVNAIKSLGFDGLSMFEDGVKNYAVFKPTQLKSAVGNLGTFDEKNPNIRYSISSPDTPAFKNWFKNSKVVDKNGKPLVMYHATNIPEDNDDLFSVFNKSDDGKLGEGIYTTSVEKYAEGLYPKGVIMPLWVSIQNPLYINLSASIQKGRSARSILKSKISGEKQSGDYLKLDTDGTKELNNRLNMEVQAISGKRLMDMSGASIRRTLQKAGYDGIIVRDTDGNFVEVNSFDQTQIKSAIGNRGTFSPKSKDIRYSLTSPVWYSELSRQIDKLPQKEMTAAEWKALLVNPAETKSRGVRGADNKVIPGKFITTEIPATSKLPGVKMKEIDDTEILEWLDVAGTSFEVDDYVDVLSTKYGVRKEEGITYPGWEESDLTADELRTLKNAQSGGRKNTKISTAEVQQFLADGGSKIEFQDVVLGTKVNWDKLEAQYNAIAGKAREESRQMNALEIKERARLHDELQAEMKFVATKFDAYKLPGGENYREAFVTVPNAVGANKEFAVFRDGDEEYEYYVGDRDTGNPVSRMFVTRNEAENSLEGFKRAGDASVKWVDGHGAYSGIDNPVVRIRFNDRVDAEGKKVLFLEELQPPNNPGFEKMPKSLQDRWLAIGLKRMIRHAAEGDYDKIAWTTGEQQVERYRDALRKQVDSIEWEKTPEGVHIKGYKVTGGVTPDRVMLEDILVNVNRALVNNDMLGFDSLGQARRGLLEDGAGTEWKNRWDIRDSSANDIAAMQAYIDAKFENIPNLVADTTYKETDLTQAIGKLMADRIRNNPSQTGTIKGEDLSIDSVGVKKLYDVGVPSLANKILKELGGGKVGEIELPKPKQIAEKIKVEVYPGEPLGRYTLVNRDGMRVTEEIYPSYESAEAARASYQQSQGALMKPDKQPAFDITPPLREKAMSGVPRYSLRDDIRNSMGQGHLDAVDRVSPTRVNATFSSRMASAISPDGRTAFRQRYLNKYEAIERLSKRIAGSVGQGFRGQAELLADTSAIAATLQSDRASGVAAEAFMSGVPVYKNGFTKVSDLNGRVKGLIPIFEPLMKYKDPFIFQMFQFYAATKRGSRLMKKGILTPVTQADLKIGADYAAKFPEFVTVFNDYQEFNKGLVRFLIDTGVLTKSMGDEFMKYSDYIPFYRQLEGIDTVGPKLFSSLSGVSPPKKMKGGDAPLADFMETVVRNARSAIESGMKNVASQRIARDVMRLNSPNAPYAQRLNKNAPDGFDVIKVRENGIDVRYRVADPLLVEAMSSMHNVGLGPLWQMAAAPTRLLRNLVTKDPSFMLANLVRDSMQAWATSGISMIPIVDTFKQYAKVLANKSPEARALRAAGIGAGYEFAGDIKSSTEAVNEALRKRTGNLSASEKAMWPLTKIWDTLEQGSNASDLATRAEIYKKTMDRTGGNEAEALYQALEVMNFSRMGNSPMIQVISALVPFFNARVQGLDVLFRSAGGLSSMFGTMATENNATRQKAFIVRTMTILGLSMMYFMLASDSDEYKRASQEVRDNNWIIGKVKIPIPFEIGVLFKVMPERIAAYFFGNDTGKDLQEAAIRNIVSTLKFNPIPQIGLPFVELAANHSFFTGESITPKSMENVAPQFQERSGTSEWAKKLSAAISAFAPEKLKLSPIQIDYLLSGYTGTMGVYAGLLVDSLINTAEGKTKPSMGIEQTPVLKRFFASDKSGGTMEAFYDLKEQVDEVTRTSKLLLEKGDANEYRSYMQDKGRFLALKPLTENINTELTELRKLRNIVNFSKMGGDEKRETLNRIRLAEIRMTEQIQSIKKRFDQR